MTPKQNLFSIPEGAAGTEEFSEPLWSAPGLQVERIISRGQATPPGAWLDQDADEWVVLLAGDATLEFEEEGERACEPGDWLFIPAHRRHRVQRTSVEPACVWLAVHRAPGSRDVL